LSTFENDTQAAEALASAVQADAAEQTSAPVQPTPPPVEANKPDEPVSGSEQEQPAPPDSFTGLDPNAIPDDLKPFYRSMQADYTRTKQKLAEDARTYEALEQFGGIEAAQEAVQFVSALATDPQYALQVHEQLTEALTQAGLTPSQASREATRQINEAVNESPAESGQSEFDDDYGLGLDPAIERRLEQTQRELEEMRQWREREEENRIQYAMMAEMERAHADVVREHNFDDDQMSAVYALAYSTGGDLRAAASVYNSLADQIVTDYIEKKASVVTPPNIQATGGGEQPVKFTDLNDPGLERLVNQRLDYERAQGNL
jgi:hypothetical protein